MKYIYSLLGLLCSHFIMAQHHISEIGTPVPGLITTNVEHLKTNSVATEENLSAGVVSAEAEEQQVGSFLDPVISDGEYKGASKGQFSVSLAGAANYSFPIEVPPGINGIIPQVGLAYNSQAANGIAGYGWNISGLSAINKVGSNRFYDGKNSMISFSSDDRFMLDGQRLLLKSGTYGMDGAEYQTEAYSNVKITSHGTPQSNYGPEYFKVQYPDGSTAYYGRKYTSFLGSATRTNTVYALTYITNPQNVIIKYSYINDNGNLLISSINYGYRSTSPLSEIRLAGYDNYISFSYKNRNRAENGYIFNEATKLTKILDKISVVGFGESFRTYQLTYQVTSLGYEQLQKITETSGDGSMSKSPLSFAYGPDSSEKTNFFTEQVNAVQDINGGSFSNLSSKNMKVIPGNFSGSGDIGFLLHHTSINDDDQQFTIGDKLHIYDPNIKKIKTINFSTPFNEVVETKGLNFNNILLPNQGWTTITKTTAAGNMGLNTYKFDSFIYMPDLIGEVALLKSKSFFLNEQQTIYYLGIGSPIYLNVPARMQYFNADLDGDGLSEVVRVQHPLNYKNALHNQFVGNVEVIDLNGSSNSVYTTNAIPLGFNYLVTDTDGDGYDELVVIRHQNIRVYKYNLSTKKFYLYSNEPTVDVKYKKPVYHGDFNGDGKLDFVTPVSPDEGKEKSTRWAFYINTGGGTYSHFIHDLGIEYDFGSEDAIWNSEQLKKEHYDFIFTDINNDGKTDILKFYSYSRTSRKTGLEEGPYMFAVWSYENMKFDDVTRDIAFSIPPTYQYLEEPTKRNPIFCVSNYSQKDYKAELALITDNKLKILKSKKNNVLTQQLKTINEFGLTTKITYDSYDEKKTKINPDPALSDVEDGVAPFDSFEDALSVYPKVDIDVAPGLYLVKKVTYDSYKGFVIGGNTTERKQLFTYADATMNLNGKGFLGFRGRMATNIYRAGTTAANKLNDQIKNATVFDMDNNSLIKEETVAHGKFWNNFFIPPAKFITKKTNTYSTAVLTNKVFKAQNTASVVNEGLTGVQRAISTTYDGYSNPLSVTETIKGGGEVSALNTVFTYINNAVDDNYYIGRESSKTVKVNNIQTSKENYTYTNHLLTNVVKQGDVGSAELSETNEYDAFGNVVKKTVSASGITPRIASYVYDSSGRYIEKTTNLEGMETSHVYNKKRGWLLSDTNPYGLTSSYSYNDLGMKISDKDYLGNLTTFAYKTNSLTSLGETFIRKETNFPDGRKERVTANGWGNKTSEGSTDLEGNWVMTSYSYDSQDRLIKKSEPYTTTASLFTTFEYDDYGRLVKNVLPTGREITTVYDGLSTTVNDGIQTRTETKNANNQTKKVVDNGETIDYTYNANGMLKNTSYGTTIISMEYDGWGRKTKMTDPSAGTYTYKYNNIGELLEETAPNGTTVHTYDATGKILTTSYSGTTISYTYNTEKLLEKVTTNTDHGTYEEKFTYDNYKRVTGKNYITPFSLNYIYNTTFDALGKMLTYTKAVIGANGQDMVQIKNVYKNGYLWKLQNAFTNADLKVYNSFNERGQVTGYSLANGLVTTRTYDAYGYLNQNEVATSGTALFTLTNSWDVQRGNLTSRSNTLFGGGINETFQYDTFDRLTQTVTKNGSVIIAQEANTYDAKGRIMSNNAGNYSYDAAKAYQLKKVENLNDLAYYQDNPLQEVTYNVGKAPLTVKQQGKENIYFRYDGSNNRTAMYYGNEAAAYTDSPKVRYYSPAGDMEVDFDKAANKYVATIYVDGNPYTSDIIQRRENGTTSLYYLHRDYLGSILAVTNGTGAIVEKRHFDAWGNILLVQDDQNNNLAKLTFLERGYTGHEHLQGVGLINMNARLYDPKLHRFLASDNFIQDPGNPQNYNLYGYVLNNPLKFTDPSGNVWHIVIGAVIGGVVNWATHGAQFNAKGLGYFGIGAGVGALAAFTGGGITSVLGGGSFMAGALGGSAAAGIAPGFISGAISGFVTGTISGFSLSLANSMYEGNSFKNSLDSALKAAIVSGAISGVTAGLISGSMAVDQDLNFWTGEGSSALLDNGTYMYDANGAVEYNDVSAKQFSDSHPELSRLSKNADNLYTQRAPDGYTYNKTTGAITDNENNRIMGVTVRRATGVFKTKSEISVYLSKQAFVSSPQLYMTMHHEYMHAYFYAGGWNPLNYYNSDEQHAIIGQWHHDQYNAWTKSSFMNPKTTNIIFGNGRAYNNAFSYLVPYGVPKAHYATFGFKLINYLP